MEMLVEVRFGVWIVVQLQDHLHNYMHPFLLMHEIYYKFQIWLY